MVAFHSVLRQRKSDSASTSFSGDDPQRGNHRQTDHRSFRLVGLVILTLIGIWLLSGITGHATHRHALLASPSFPGLSAPKGTQAGGVEIPSQKTSVQTPAIPAFCLPTDIPCLLNEAAKWAAQQILGIFLPLIEAMNHHSLNFISQTPICVSGCPTTDSPYQHNPTIVTFVKWSVGVVNVAVAVFIVLGGYNLMMARQIGASYADVAEFIPRMALAVMAANLCLFFLQFFIDLENALSLEVVHLFALHVLSDMIVGIFRGDVIGGGLLMIALAIILGVMNLLLAWQMLVRLALLFILLVLAPLGLLCFGLPQTQGYGRLWTSTFAVTLFVQFFQVVALALGGMLISYVQTTGLLTLDQAVVSLLVSTAVMYLVLRIPGMMRSWALRPVAEAGLAPGRTAGRLITMLAG